MKKEPICFKHQEIINICEHLLALDYSKPFKNILKKELKKVIELAEVAREDGQKMEDRLDEYYDGITDLGFKRVKKRK